ncbi:MAG: ATP-binding protein [Gemmatimonadota bacterium]|nr:ATP-binding protein [Gemmatimonadota bacterium]MDE2872191.1 ATP-binding protein [Gemmatimonadota bacterium]
MLDSPGLYPRPLANVLRDALADTPVVCLAGPRQSGKSTLVRAMLPERPYFSLDHGPYLTAARSDPAGFVAALPREATIDEVQRAPELLPAIKLSVDRDRRPGRFVLTGSANLLVLPTVTESLAGRMEVARLLPLSEAEKERRRGLFLADLLAGSVAPALRPGVYPPDPADLARRLVAGGYPEPLTRSPARARQWHRQYVRSIVDRDVLDVGRVRDADGVARLLSLLAVRNGEPLNTAGLSRELGLHRSTVREYVAVLERLFLVRRLPAWHRNVGRRLVRMPKLHVMDSGLAATLAGLAPGDWIERRARMGHLLEAFAVQQLTTLAGWTDPDIRFWHYRDRDGREVDLVMTLGARTWGIEVKATSTPGRSAGRGMARLAALCRDDFEGGIVLYNGRDILPLAGDGTLAVPLGELWTR